jgi:hypothetical protein
MIGRLVVISATAIVVAGPSLAGPCTQRLAELEKAITAQQEGSGPALKGPATTGSTASTPASTPQSQNASEAMRMVQEAKQLDQQGKESECMQAVSRIEGMVPSQTK